MKRKAQGRDGLRCSSRAVRTAILDAAAEAFAEKGFALASVRDICARADVGATQLYHAFASKSALYRAAAKAVLPSLCAPLAALPAGVRTVEDWRAAVRTWVAGCLALMVPTRQARLRGAAIFRHEVMHPTAFFAEFRQLFGWPVYAALRDLLARAVRDRVQLELWTASVWAQVCAYAQADRAWHPSGALPGVSPGAWTERTGAFICETLFRALEADFRETP